MFFIIYALPDQMIICITLYPARKEESSVEKKTLRLSNAAFFLTISFAIHCTKSNTTRSLSNFSFTPLSCFSSLLSLPLPTFQHVRIYSVHAEKGEEEVTTSLKCTIRIDLERTRVGTAAEMIGYSVDPIVPYTRIPRALLHWYHVYYVYFASARLGTAVVIDALLFPMHIHAT